MKKIFDCRSCGGVCESIIPLGELPLANALLTSTENVVEEHHNLEVMMCGGCGLAQLRDLIDPKDLFSEYVYFSSNSSTMLKSAADLVNRISLTLPDDAYVIEVASNDGYLLKNYVDKGIKVLGIDPAKNIAKIANENGVPTLCDFFGKDLALKLADEGKKADIIHANNVMAHVPDINGFIAGIKALLKPNGYAVIEVPYFLDLVQKLEFDTIYHEHVFYFTVKALDFAFKRSDLVIHNIEKIAIHGGTLRIYVGHAGKFGVLPIVQSMIDRETRLYELKTYEKFMNNLEDLKLNLVKMLDELKGEKAKIAAYGASAKGTTLLNYFGIDSRYLDFVVDKSPVKQGLFTPGTHLKIEDPKVMMERNIDYALLLAWNFADEIIGQQEHFTKVGGKFIIPLPQARIAA